MNIVVNFILYFQELTTWANDVLKQKNCRPIGDLRKSIADGLTLVNLVEILGQF